MVALVSGAWGGWCAGDHTLAEADVRGSRHQVAAELFELLVLRRRGRLDAAGELGPGQDQVVALELGLADARPLAELMADALGCRQRGDEVVLPDALPP